LTDLIKKNKNNLEEFIDKTVNGFEVLKDDLMNFNEASQTDLRKRQLNVDDIDSNYSNCNGSMSTTNSNSDAYFMKKEIDALNAAVQQVNVLPAVLSNGHAK